MFGYSLVSAKKLSYLKEDNKNLNFINEVLQQDLDRHKEENKKISKKLEKVRESNKENYSNFYKCKKKYKILLKEKEYEIDLKLKFLTVILKFRKEQGKNYCDIAKDLGVDKTYLSHIINGKEKMNLETMNKCIEILIK